MLKPKVGDLVRLKPVKITAVVVHDNVFVISGGCITYRFSIADVEAILPHPIAVGDRVLLTVGGDCPSDVYGEILAVDGKTGWVRRDDGLYATAALDDLRRTTNDGEGK